MIKIARLRIHGEIFKQIYQEMITLLIDIKGIDPHMFEYGISFGLKIFGIEKNAP